jgi:Mg2+-importing ATPase
MCQRTALPPRHLLLKPVKPSHQSDRALAISDAASAFWSLPASDLLQQLHSGPRGISGAAAKQSLLRYGPNRLRPRARGSSISLLAGQFKSPIIIILAAAAILSFALQDRVGAIIILAIVLLSGLLGFWQERGAASAVEKLLAVVQLKAEVLRDGASSEIPVEHVVPGDVVVLNAGDVVPGDGLILDSTDLFIDEATLTGETFPEEKRPGLLPESTPLAERSNSLFMGTHVVSGECSAVVVRTGLSTEFGRVAGRLAQAPAETEFERGVRHFGYLLMEITFVMLLAVFAFNVLLARPVLDSFLFALALAVGLTPQLLPAIISVNLAHGAQKMAGAKVIVKRLASIENFGSMNVLCSDKTGTLTEGVVQIRSWLGVDSQPLEKVLLYAYLNASFQRGFTNPIDLAIQRFRAFDLEGYEKLGEVPYDFIRKRLSILVAHHGRGLMITKGALSSVLEACATAETRNGSAVPLDQVTASIHASYERYSGLGHRVLGVAWRDMGDKTTIGKADEAQMTFLGFLVFFDPPKPNILDTINQLRASGVALKVITGDNRLVSAHLAETIGLTEARLIAGQEISQMSDSALAATVNSVHVFAEVEPNQKERIILALRKAGNVVGYMGDGINDASALHAADVGISVESAVDVAKEAADIVLLEKNLSVLVEGVHEGRRTFANTMKYVFMATSANFGNMFSMAGASLLLPFLPLLPTQILLMNLLTDLPEMTIASDSVDPELVLTPRRWDVNRIRNFMLVFGPLSSVFDFLTFGALILLLGTGPAEFRAGWFMESVVSASLVVLVVRTRRPFFKSLPSRYLLMATLAVAATAAILPFTPLGAIFQFAPLPPAYLLVMAVIIAGYVFSAEVAKHIFYRRTAR